MSAPIDLPAFCRECGRPFASGIVMQGATNITFGGGTAGPCPNCGGRGDILQGTFDAIGSTLKMLSGPQISRERVWRLQELIQREHQAGASPERIEAELVREFPEAQSMLEQWHAMPSLAKVNMVMGTLAFILAFGPWSGDLDVAVKWILEYLSAGPQR